MSDATPPASYTFEVPSYPQVFVPAPAPRQRYWLHILLFLLTLLTTLIVGARLQYDFSNNLPAFSTERYAVPTLVTQHIFHHQGQLIVELPFPMKWAFEHPRRLLLGMPFAVTLLGILLAHEMGHYVCSLKNNVRATLPYFIPGLFISPIGTFGALIRIKSPIRSRKALFDIGIAGPIAGFVVALPVLLWGLALSKPRPPEAAGSVLDFGYPLIFSIFHHWLAPFMHEAAPLRGLYLHPVGVAAWVGMFATALNLLPGGQFDGGHIVYALAPRAHRWVTRTTIAILIPLGAFFWIGWWVWALILTVTGMRHPNVPQWPDIGRERRWLAMAALLMLVLTLVLAPLRGAALFGN
jgi:membrane-associated protease RseP (regulator of RpoE activity)